MFLFAFGDNILVILPSFERNNLYRICPALYLLYLLTSPPGTLVATFSRYSLFVINLAL